MSKRRSCHGNHALASSVEMFCELQGRMCLITVSVDGDLVIHPYSPTRNLMTVARVPSCILYLSGVRVLVEHCLLAAFH